MHKSSKTILKKLSPQAQINLMIEAAQQHNTLLIKNVVQILIEQDRIKEVGALDEPMQQVFLKTLEELLVSAVHQQNEKAFQQIIQRMQTIKNYPNYTEFYDDIIPLQHFADALADESHEQFLNLIRNKHFLADEYLIFLAIKTHHKALFQQLEKIGIDLSKLSQALELLRTVINSPNIQHDLEQFEQIHHIPKKQLKNK